ncbi:MAG: hypothetical protein ACRDQ5_17755 [Sciscionella sp.]
MAILSLAVGVLLVTVVPGGTAHLVGLGVWWFGTLMVIDLFLGDGLPAQILWALGVAGAVAAYQSGWVGRVTEGVGPLVVTILGVLFVPLALVGSRRRKRPTASKALRDLGSQVAERAQSFPDPRESIARLQVVMTEHIERLRPDHAGDAQELSRLLRDYKTSHGMHTVDTSPRPEVLRTSVTKLVRDMASVRQQRPVGAPGHTHLVVVTRYAELLEALALGIWRG